VRTVIPLSEPDQNTGSSRQGVGRNIRILIDGHGGDHAPAMVLDALEAVLSTGFLNRFSDPLTFGIIGQADVLRPLLQQRDIADRVSLVSATDVVGMCDSPSHALTALKKILPFSVGARLVRDNEWDALVSAGNTGALMAISKVILKTLPGIDRPAIASMIPAVNGGRTLMLDAGANTECNSDHLVQFAIMGSCYMQAAEGVQSPRIGLLNIGSEDIKGTDVIKLTSAKLAESGLNYIGNVEGTDLFGNDVDVVVCDGFVGNVALKTMEGTATFLANSMKHELTSGVVAKAGGVAGTQCIAAF